MGTGDDSSFKLVKTILVATIMFGSANVINQFSRINVRPPPPLHILKSVRNMHSESSKSPVLVRVSCCDDLIENNS